MGRITVSVRDIVGTHVENWQGENLGNITDVMLDKRDGDILYLVLSYPGEYGIRYPNKRFAVPFDAIVTKLRNNDTEGDYIMNVDEEFLKKAPGYDKDNPPDFADTRFISAIKDYYKDVSVDIMV